MMDCNSWRGIMLLSTTNKVLSRVILNRISSSVNPLLKKEQTGFRRGRSCADKIFNLRQIVEQTQVICGAQLSEEFYIRIGVKQGCLPSPLLFTLCIDWVMKEITSKANRGITWT
ncbi:uncharacterized protein LOC130050692 [Ostrea edulis]|uniref:uncharacterized protein LOC130050692 n=1 Tax=Ostrea edulis TaxID=37623 RepID=UPI0024AED123|nr:uncharacterized protein LOC130050692 [Ostrea edulis]